MRILVTGGNGMVGSHIKNLVEKAKRKDETMTEEEQSLLNEHEFKFLTRSDCELTSRMSVLHYFSGNKNYWKHIFWTPNVPNVMRIIILPIEIIGVFTKPFSLMIRLFVAITAGHIVLLSFIGMTFIFQSYFVGILSSLFAVALNIIELLVAAIQAYVFTMFSSVYIGLAIEEEH